jgi:hypothetical protein
MALGADRVSVVGLVLRGASFRVLLGLILGIPLAIGAGRLLSAQLYGVSSWDPLARRRHSGNLRIFRRCNSRPPRRLHFPAGCLEDRLEKAVPDDRSLRSRLGKRLILCNADSEPRPQQSSLRVS